MICQGSLAQRFQDANMLSCSHFLSLPRELRNIIYEHYVLDEGDGYHFNHSKRKFRASNGQPIDLSLMYTCKCVNAEMRGLHLGKNILIFSTMSLEGKDSTATRFHWALNGLLNEKMQQLSVKRRITSDNDIKEQVIRKYPNFMHAFHDWSSPYNLNREGRELSCWGETRSVFWGFVNYTLNLLWDHENSDFLEGVRRCFGEADPIRLARLLALDPSPWAIPSEDEVAEMENIVRFPHSMFFDENDKHFQRNCIRHRFSAAAVAIRFFESTSPQTMLQIRKVLLHEDRESIAYPAAHGMGLVKLCLASPQLQIERRVSVWFNLLPAGSDGVFAEAPLHRINDTNETGWSREKDRLHSSEISDPFSVWIEEALGLYDAGMPIGSFSLVFDGDGAYDLSSEVFEVVIQDAAWQEALDKWIKQRSLHLSFKESRMQSCYKSEKFPQAVRSMVEGNSPIRCNFPIAGLWDVQQVLDENSANSDLEDWEINWCEKHDPQTFLTTTPLPSWVELRLNKVIPAEER